MSQTHNGIFNQNSNNKNNDLENHENLQEGHLSTGLYSNNRQRKRMSNSKMDRDFVLEQNDQKVSRSGNMKENEQVYRNNAIIIQEDQSYLNYKNVERS